VNFIKLHISLSLLLLASGVVLYYITGLSDVRLFSLLHMKSLGRDWGSITRNYLPDALWMGSFLSFTLGVMSHYGIYWMSIALFSCLAFALTMESLQYMKIINGTGDLIDMAIYLLVAACYYFLTISKNKNHIHEPRNITIE